MSTTPTDGPQGPGEDPAGETGAPPPPPPPGGRTDTQTDPRPGPQPGPRAAQRDLGTLRRSSTDRHLAGVAGGLARHFDIDPIIVRVALVVLIFFGGAGLVLYGAVWLLVPQDDEPSAVVALDERSRSFLLYVAGAVAVLMLLGDTLGHFHMPWPVLIIALIVVALVAGKGQVRLGRRTRSPELAETTAAYAAQVETQVRQRVDEHVQAVTARYASYPPVNPRKRGPILFWFTIALIALAEGVLGIVDLAGVDVAPPAYAALAVGVVGLMLVIGAFWGRAGGLILLGLVASLVLAGSLAADKWQLDGHSRSVTYTPASAALVDDTYRMGTGDLIVDLSQVSDPAALAGRTIDVSGHVGSIEIVVPAQIAATADAAVRGPGQVEVFGEGHGGIHPRRTGSVAGSLTSVPLSIDANLNVGKITVETSDER